MPDARVQAAIDHWAPRFVQAGVDYSDFVATTAGVEQWEEWHGAWCRNGDIHAGLAGEAADEGAAAHRRRGLGAGDRGLPLREVRLDGGPGASRDAADQAVAAMAKTHEFLDPAAERIEVPLDGGARRGEPAPAAPGRTGRRSCSSCPGSTPRRRSSSGSRTCSSTAGWRRCRSTGRARASRATSSRSGRTTRSPWRRCSTRSRGATTSTSTGSALLGVSLGGYYAPRVLAFEPRVKAGVGLSGPYRFGDIWDDVPPQTRETFVVKSFAKDEEEGRGKADELDLPAWPSGSSSPISRHGQARPPDPVGADRARRTRGAERRVPAPRGRQPRLRERAYKTRPVMADWLREQLG